MGIIVVFHFKYIMNFIASIFLYHTSFLVASTYGGCSFSDRTGCADGKTCYNGDCRTAKEIAWIAFEAGKPCSSHSDCKEACMKSGECGPYLRSGRIPPVKHEDQCSTDKDCSSEEDSCIATLRGMECKTWEQLMKEVFKLGTSCSQDSECPEACYINNDPATCGPYL